MLEDFGVGILNVGLLILKYSTLLDLYKVPLGRNYTKWKQGGYIFVEPDKTLMIYLTPTSLNNCLSVPPKKQ